jgi:hypothetical protein
MKWFFRGVLLLIGVFMFWKTQHTLAMRGWVFGTVEYFASLDNYHASLQWLMGVAISLLATLLWMGLIVIARDLIIPDPDQ